LPAGTTEKGHGELIREEAQPQEQVDDAPTGGLGEARGVMDGREVVLAFGVQSALDDKDRT
jgi:hypothetical protein